MEFATIFQMLSPHSGQHHIQVTECLLIAFTRKYETPTVPSPGARGHFTGKPLKNSEQVVHGICLKIPPLTASHREG